MTRRTLVGEKGITLSGGQRQRIALARAAYDSTADIVLLDDCLSAVDAHVAHRIFRDCILQGPFAQKTRLLVTHNFECLPRADWIIVMDQEDNIGRIAQQGTYAVCALPIAATVAADVADKRPFLPVLAFCAVSPKS